MAPRLEVRLLVSGWTGSVYNSGALVVRLAARGPKGQVLLTPGGPSPCAKAQLSWASKLIWKLGGTPPEPAILPWGRRQIYRTAGSKGAVGV